MVAASHGPGRRTLQGVDKRTTKDAAVTAYATGDGLHYANTQINAWIDGGWTATGTLRYYDGTTRSAPNDKSVEVAFCADSGKFFGKEIKTQKILKTKPSIEDFDYFKIVMVKFPTNEGLWQASKVFVETRAEKCRSGHDASLRRAVVELVLRERCTVHRQRI
ncbi:hypothetical protein GCM10010270_71180 [Streptomyces violaceus]|nr:hypothetical protein GCM10010270_71180 [Streptomyces janthinus]